MTGHRPSAATAAATVLIGLPPHAAPEIRVAPANYLAAIPDGAPKADGIRLGEAVAANVLQARANDGAGAPDAYRPKTRLAIYMPTPITVASTWPSMTPFALESPRSFGQPPDLAGERGVSGRLQRD